MSAKHIKRIRLCMATVLIIPNLKAQPKVSNWVTMQLPVSMNAHWQWLNEYSYRTMGASVSMYQLFLRTGARYTFNTQWNVASSLDIVRTRTTLEKSNHHYGMESRIWQEVNHYLTLPHNYIVQHRLRIEERFFSVTENQPAYTGYRFRYRLGLLKKLNTRWSLFTSDEFVEEAAKKRISFNQNRIYINTTCRLKENMQIQAGYYFVFRPEGKKSHVAAISLQKSFHLHEKKQ